MIKIQIQIQKTDTKYKGVYLLHGNYKDVANFALDAAICLETFRDEGIIFIDTSNVFEVFRVYSKYKQYDLTDAFKNIYVSRPATYHEFKALIDSELEKFLSFSKINTVIIPSIKMPFKDSLDYPEATTILYLDKTIKKLKILAKKYNLFILLGSEFYSNKKDSLLDKVIKRNKLKSVIV